MRSSSALLLIVVLALTLGVQAVEHRVKVSNGATITATGGPKRLAETDGCPCKGSNKRILNVMTFNIEGGFRLCPFEMTVCAKAVAEMIVQHEVDVAGFQEFNTDKNNLRFVVDELNKIAGDGIYRLQNETEFITRLRVLAFYPWGGSARCSGILAEIVPLRYSWFFSCHLTAYPYGPYLIRDGKKPDEVLAVANKLQLVDIQELHNRVWKVADAIKNMDPTADNPFKQNENVSHPVLPGNYPVIVMGDFNMPSHKDWTILTSSSPTFTAWRGGYATVPIDWPVTKFLESNGYVDVFREFYPDPLATPGFTWTPLPATKYPEVHDRIDYIMYRPYAPNFKADSEQYKLKTVQALRIEPEVNGKMFSDHRAVFGRVEFTYPQVGNVVPPDQPVPKPPTRSSSMRLRSVNHEDDWTT